MNPSSVIPVSSYLNTDMAEQNQPQPMANAAPATPQSHGNILTRLLPTIGGIGGGLLGTMVSPILGSAGGAAAGSALGQELENAITGSKTGLVSTAAQNAVGGLLGGLGGEAFGAFTGKLGSMADEAGINSLMKQAGGFLNKDDAQFLYNSGVKNFTTAAKVAPEVTGGAGGEGAVFHNNLLNALDNAGHRVDLTTTFANTNGLLEPHVIDLDPRQVKLINDDIQTSYAQMAAKSGYNVEKVPVKGAANAPQLVPDPAAMKDMSPRAVFDQGKMLTDKGYQLMSKSTYGDAKAAQADVLIKLGNQLKDKALGTDIGGEAMLLSDADRAALKEGISNIKSISPEAHAGLENYIDNAQTWQDINKGEGVWARIGQANRDLEAKAQTSIGMTPMDIVKGTQGMTPGIRGTIKSAIGGSLGGPTANKVETSALAKFGDMAQGKVAQKVLPLAIRAGAIGMANVPNMASSQSGGVTTPTSSNNMNAGVNTMQGAGNPISDLFNTLMMQEQAGAGLTPNAGSMVAGLQALAPMLQKQQLASSAIANLLPTFVNAGGAQGGAGIISRLTGFMPGTAANTYDQQSSAAAAAIGQLLGISPAQAQGLIPQLMQSQQTAMPQVGGVQSILGGIMPTQ